MSTAGERVFERYKRRMVPAAFVVTMLTMLIGGLCLSIGPLGLPLFGAFMWLALDRFILFGNEWLRRSLHQRLEALGEPAQQPTARFVGLAHPCHYATMARRLIETDDDVGFLTVTHEGLDYHGDSISFKVPLESIRDVQLVRSAYAPWPRVAISIADGEPFDEIVFDSRQFTSHRRCRQDTRELYHALRGLLLLLPPGSSSRLSPRLTGEQRDQISASA